uniref:Major allergen I polypeptide chain 1-like n=1 Tax=Jaculus jaculus TaxID=51337 RepID=A0A8C5NZG2_JACJA
MSLAGALGLLGAALLLTTGGNCDICPAVRKDVSKFLDGSKREYVGYLQNYVNDPAVLANAATLKTCVDEKLTEEDKALVGSALEKIYTSRYCS